MLTNISIDFGFLSSMISLTEFWFVFSVGFDHLGHRQCSEEIRPQYAMLVPWNCKHSFLKGNSRPIRCRLSLEASNFHFWSEIWRGYAMLRTFVLNFAYGKPQWVRKAFFNGSRGAARQVLANMNIVCWPGKTNYLGGMASPSNPETAKSSWFPEIMKTLRTRTSNILQILKHLPALA